MARAALTVLLFLALAAPAHAAGTVAVVDTKPALEGPVWVGDRVAWVAPALRGLSLHLAEPSGDGHVVRTLDQSYGQHLGFSASAERWAVTMFDVGPCDLKGMCNYSGGPYTAPLGEQPVPFTARCASTSFGPVELAVSENAVARSCENTVRVHDFAEPPGAADSREFASGRGFQLAGPFLATPEKDDATTLTVREWRSGAERLRLTDVHGRVLQPDGKVAFARPGEGRGEVAWASPESPQPRVVATGSGIRVLGFAQDRVALVREGRLELRALDGTLLSSSPSVPPTVDSAAFDGRRFVWAERPCTALAIVTWDLEGAPPTLGSGRCPHAGNRSDVLRAKPAKRGPYGFGAISTTLECPAEPRLGCGGTLELRLGPGKLGIARGTYELMPGTTQRVELGLLKGRICKAGRDALGPVQLTIDGVKRRWVRISGIRRALARC